MLNPPSFSNRQSSVLQKLEEMNGWFHRLECQNAQDASSIIQSLRDWSLSSITFHKTTSEQLKEVETKIVELTESRDRMVKMAGSSGDVQRFRETLEISTRRQRQVARAQRSTMPCPPFRAGLQGDKAGIHPRSQRLPGSKPNFSPITLQQKWAGLRTGRGRFENPFA